MRSGEVKAKAVASTGRERSNTSLAAPESCETRTPTATGGPASVANPGCNGAAIKARAAKAASHPIRAIPLPLGPARKSRYRANVATTQSVGVLIRSRHARLGNRAYAGKK